MNFTHLVVELLHSRCRRALNAFGLKFSR
jgi:hypothetical protein